MLIAERVTNGTTVLTLTGEFNFNSRREFNAAVDKVLAGACTHLMINLEGISFLDSAALGLLAITHQRLKGQQRRMSLLKPRPYVYEVLKLAKIHEMIPVHETEAEAARPVVTR